MTESIRLNKKEKKEIEKKAKEINMKLIQIDEQPMKESEIIHKILEITIEKADINEQGKIEINLNLGQESTTK